MSSVIFRVDAETNEKFDCSPSEPLPPLNECIYFIAACSNATLPKEISLCSLLAGNQEYLDLRDNIRHLSGIIHDLNSTLEQNSTEIREKNAENERQRETIRILMQEREEVAPAIGKLRDLLPCITDTINRLLHEDTSAEASVSLGRLCSALKYNDSAKRFFHRALKQEPANAEALFNIGRIYHESGKFIIAEEYLKKALQCDPDLAEARLLSGINTQNIRHDIS
jgi:tetratricopeptide (TPR) repeat protein